ncbi:hypothetical protein EsH8_IV_001139 [Colletotrichum jinshuiense]
MRLLHTGTQQLHTFPFPPPVSYAILSHTWSSPSDDEWTRYNIANTDTTTGTLTLHGIIDRACHLAQAEQIEFVWIDAACIVKSSSADISESINLLPKYFKAAAVCFAFLSDLPCGERMPCQDTWTRCQFWNRAWTLQELILPSKIQFYDAQWHPRGERNSNTLSSLISHITGIDEDVLTHRKTLCETSVARKMSWAACKEVSKPEDIAYALLGIFDLCMPIVYGEGKERAFRRLQEEIIKSNNDMTLFAWTCTEDEDCRGIFANDPENFLEFGRLEAARMPFNFDGLAALTNRGVLFQGQISVVEDDVFLDFGPLTGEKHEQKHYGILVRRQPGGTYTRDKHSKIMVSSAMEKTTVDQILVSRRFTDEPKEAITRAGTLFSHQEDSRAASRKSFSLPISLKSPPEPLSDQHSGQQAVSDSTPTGSTPNSSQQYLKEDPDWVNILENPFEVLPSDDSDDDYMYQSMEMSQATDTGWGVAGSVMSEPTTVASPPQIENEDEYHSFHSSHLGNDSVEALPAAVGNNYKDNTKHKDENLNIRTRLSRAVLDRFFASQEVSNRLVEKRRRWANTSLGKPRKAGRGRSYRNLTRLEHPEFSCPFFKKDPEKYMGCLTNHELADMEDIREHIWLKHRLPIHCPNCKDSFDSAADRDRHIVKRTCEFQDIFPYEGISEDQNELISYTEGSLSDRKQWFQVWDIVFPDLLHPDSPHLRRGLGLKVANFRAFWKRSDQSLLDDCLKECFHVSVFPYGQDAKALLSETFSEAIKLLVEESTQQGF